MMKKDFFFTQVGRREGGSCFVFGFVFFLCFCFSHVYSARSIEEGHVGKGRTKKGADGSLRWTSEGLSQGWEGRV